MTSEVYQKGKRAKAASYVLNIKTTCEKNDALTKIAEQLLIDQDILISENLKDLANGKEKGMATSTLDRIMLNKERITAMADAIHLLVKLNDPVGTTLEHIEKDNGLLY
ncbi:Gamma-glutamyl phosphate reductase OS=Lysinibacillus sphaericus OX=1421 GN=proA PE=3 SV=1 [Lysinibacillus sphaericus]